MKSRIFKNKPQWFADTVSLCFIVVILFAANGCIKQEEPEFEYDSVVTKIEAKVENASKFSNVVLVKLMVYDSNARLYNELASGAWKDGGFTIALPETLDPYRLHALKVNGIWINLYSPPTMDVSNKNVNVLDEFLFLGVDKYGKVVANFRPSPKVKNDDPNAAFYDTMYFFYIYVDSDASISGSSKSVFDVIATVDYTGPMSWTKNTTYSIDWKKGWNVWWSSRTYDEQEAVVEEKYSSGPFIKPKWRGEKTQ